MATQVKMPQLSDTMNAGKILSWHKAEGQQVNRGEMLAEVETDKANLEIECFTPGTLLKIVVPPGASAKVGEVVAVIGTPGESVDITADAPPYPQGQTKAPAVPMGTEPSLTAQSQQSSDRLKASPLARKLAAASQVDLTAVKGSGPGGRVIRKDVEAARSGVAPATEARPSSPRPSSSLPAMTGEARYIPLSKMRETIGRRMQESATQAPHFYMTASIDMEQAVKLREVLKDLPEYKGISINHLVIKAAAYALRLEPRANWSFRDDQLFNPGQINIGMITAVEEGLLIPVIKNVDQMHLRDLVFEARAAVERARAGRPTSTDLSGGTFSISNMGMFDVDNFTAIINPGQGAVLAVSSVRSEPVVKNGQVTAGTIMKVTLSADHRVMDAIVSAQFLGHFRQALENPALITL